MTKDNGNTRKKMFLTLLALTFLLPVISSALPDKIVSSLNIFIDRYSPFLLHAASNTGFPNLAKIYYSLSIALLPAQYIIVAWYVSCIPLAKMRRLRDIYADGRAWLSIKEVKLIDNKWGVLLACIVFTAMTIFAVFYAGPGFGVGKRGTLDEIFIFFVMNTMGVMSLLLYGGVFVMWARLIHSNKDR
ncbi:hypothetical protein [Dyella ginsengisoli]|uniref:hypothetical protein n=1 Tax=Dyella ginsengisoli TaxID=363848 RepID=UPI0012FE6CF4|nr:hypothetical protein [Dyella ginsengisoli]